MKVQDSKAHTLFTANTVMDRYFDQYDYFSFDRKYTEPQSRKGRSKRECQQNTNRHVPAGHERKVVTKYQNTEKNRKEEQAAKKNWRLFWLARIWRQRLLPENDYYSWTANREKYMLFTLVRETCIDACIGRRYPAQVSRIILSFLSIIFILKAN